MPNGNIGVAIVALNTLIYGLYFMWPKYNMHTFFNNFTFNKMSLQSGHLWAMLLCHFTHMGFINYAIDSLIIFLLCQNLSFMFGGLYITKTILLSMLMGSALVFL